jgi:hypothetical protein
VRREQDRRKKGEKIGSGRKKEKKKKKNKDVPRGTFPLGSGFS